MLADVVKTMPGERRQSVRLRFETALSALDRHFAKGQPLLAIASEYFAMGIACPFLEDESCSIHLDRPVTCREYLVTSPAANCACPRKDNIDLVPLPAKVWTALARFDEGDPKSKYCRWVPLVLAPEWAEAHPNTLPSRPGPELLREFFERLAGQLPTPAAAEASSPAT